MTNNHTTGLILTVGMSPEPIIYTLQQLQPDYVAYLCTSASRATLDRVAQQYPMPPSKLQVFQVEDQPQAIGKLVRTFYDAFRWLRDECNIAQEHVYTDPTPGRKWMSAGATMIASFLGLNMFYVDVKFQDRQPQPGTEQLVQLGNAYSQTGFLEAEKARELFNGFNFAASGEIFRKLAPLLSAEHDLYDGLALLCDAVHRWDLFEHYDPDGSVQQAFGNAFSALGRALESMSLPAEFREFVGQMHRLSEAIEEVGASQKPTLLATVDLINNAQRRIERGRYDDAMARLYRALESIAQYYLSTHGIDVANPDWSQLTSQQLEAIKARLEGLPDEISLANGWQILWVLGHRAARLVFHEKTKGAKKELHNKFQPVLKQRNNSILAHGWQPVSREAVGKMLEKIKKLVEQCEPDWAPEAFSRFDVPRMPSLYAAQAR